MFYSHDCSSQNPRKSGEDDATWHARLGRIFKEKYGEEFRFLACYFFLRDKPKFLTLVTDRESQEDDGSKKRSVGAKEDHPIGNKRAKAFEKNRSYS